MNFKKRLAVISTHPIQYNAPFFKLLSTDLSFAIKVFYTWSQSKEEIFDKEFGLAVKWDIPLLEGYDYTFVLNTSSSPGSHSFNGIVNPALNKEIEEWKADALLVYGWAFSSHLKAIRYFHNKIPVIFRGDSTLLDEPRYISAKKLARRIFLRWVYSHVDYALYVGSANQKYFLANGLKPKQLLFAPHAVDNNRFANNNKEYDEQAAKMKTDFGIKNNEIVFLFAAKLTVKKDSELLIKAFISLDNSNSKLIIVGNGELESELREKYKSNASIIFIDFQNQSVMPMVYRLGDVFVLPSKGPGETWGLAVNEAMASGRAVIVSDKCGCSFDLVSQGKNGYVFENGNQQSLKQAMELSLRRFKEQGINSRQMIKHWSYQQTADQLKGLLLK